MSSAVSMSVSTLTSPSPPSNSTVTSPSRNSADHSEQFTPGEGENFTRKRREAETTRATLVKGPGQRLPLYKSEKTYSGNVSRTSLFTRPSQNLQPSKIFMI